MSATLVHLGGATWVNPEEIVAVTWNSARMEECPRIVLRSGHTINATRYQRASTIETAESATERMLRDITRKTQRQAAAFWGYAGYSGVDPATP